MRLVLVKCTFRCMGLLRINRRRASTTILNAMISHSDDNSRGGVKVFIAACLFIRTMSQKPMQLRSPNLKKKCFTMSPGNPLILESKGLRSMSPVTTLPMAAYASHAGFSLLQCPAAQAMLATLGVLCRFHGNPRVLFSAAARH